MFQEKICVRWVKLALALLSAMGARAAGGGAQAGRQQDERVEITGSNIRRIAQEGVLPITHHQDIKRSGATSVLDVLRNLPSVGAVISAAATASGTAPPRPACAACQP